MRVASAAMIGNIGRLQARHAAGEAEADLTRAFMSIITSVIISPAITESCLRILLSD